METQHFNRVFSERRVKKYFDQHHQNQTLAIEHYLLNMELSECFYSILSIYEVCLRSKIDRELSRHSYQHFQTSAWYDIFCSEQSYRRLGRKIQKAMRVLREEGKVVNSDNLIPELPLGFWTTLFNDNYERTLWQPLRRVFSNVPRRQRQRRSIKNELNRIRKF